jgi:hypothetical protein
MYTDISSPLTTKSSRADRYNRVFQRSEYKFKIPNHGTAPNFSFMNGQILKFELLKHVTAPNFLLMLKLPRSSLPYHHSAHRQVSLQLFHRGQICRPWRRLYASQLVTQFDPTNTSNNPTFFGGAGSAVVFGLVSYACGGLRFDSPGVSLLFSGRGPAFQKNMVASNVTRCLRFETLVWIGNKQASKKDSPTI